MSLRVSEAKSHIFNTLCLAVLSKCLLLMQRTVTIGETDLGTEQRRRHAPPPPPSEPWAPVPSNLGSQGHLQEDCSVHKHFRTINGQHYVPAGPGDPAPQMINPTISQLPSVSCQTQPVGMEPASSWAPPSALPGATPHSPVAPGPITEKKMDAWGFSVAHGEESTMA